MIAALRRPADNFGRPDLVIVNSKTVLATPEPQETLAAGTLVCFFNRIKRMIPFFFIFWEDRTFLMAKFKILHLTSAPFRLKKQELLFILPHSHTVVQDYLS